MNRLNSECIPAFGDDIHINDNGGSQTQLPVRSDLLPPDVLLRIAKVLADGAVKHGENNWKKIEADDHLNHALTHLYRYSTGDRTEPHIVHALCRLLFLDHVNHNKD